MTKEQCLNNMERLFFGKKGKSNRRRGKIRMWIKRSKKRQLEEWGVN